jgi:GH24 family phage-related lysozyme (muramidase)
MQASDTCRNQIKAWESCKFAIYDDLNGHPTIGIGHKLTPPELTSAAYTEGITQDEADSLFLADLAPVEAQVDALGHWTQGQFDALTSFTYNLGITATKTMLAHGLAMVPQELILWVHAGGKIAPGLVSRRALEVVWWNSM